MNDAIRLTDLRVRYGRVRALDGLSLSVARGEIYGFLGRNGAGKTTTLRVLMGIVGADGGTIELFGQPMKRVSVARPGSDTLSCGAGAARPTGVSGSMASAKRLPPLESVMIRTNEACITI